MLNEFLLLAIAHIVAVASPGVDFAVVLKNTLQCGKKAGALTAIGIGCGISVHIVYTIFGFALILSKNENLLLIIKIVGAIYLLWIAWQAFHSRMKKMSVGTSSESVTFDLITLSNYQAFRQGFLTNVFNPKATLFFLVLFTNIVSPETPVNYQIIYGFWLTLYTMLWFLLVVWLFSRKPVLNWYERNGHFIDWGMGAFLVFIALKLVW